jgi:hypothetical protein
MIFDTLISQGYQDYKEKQKSKLRNADLFSLDFKRLNWFFWGDILFVVASLMFLFQPFFLVFISKDRYSDQKDKIYFFTSKGIHLLCLYYIFLICYSFFSSLTANVIMLVDSVMYQVGYHMYMNELGDSILAGIKRLRTSNLQLHDVNKSEIELQTITSKSVSSLVPTINPIYDHHANAAVAD